MKNKILSFLLVSFFTLLSTPLFAGMTLIGAGATFPYPLYTKWAESYDKQTGVSFNYQPIGSGGGLKQIQNGTVDFGASDKPLSMAELKASDLVQFPTVVGGVVPVVNIAGITSGQVKLSGTVLADIYLGKIKKWNDPKITALNPGVTLPDSMITVVHRSDGSGTTFLFTDYLSKVSEGWKKQVGSDTAVSWPAGIGGKGNEGVASYVQRVKGSIGYVEYAFAQQNNLAYLQMINDSGQAVLPSLKTFEAASANANWKTDTQFAEILTNQPGANSWPIAGATFILMKRIQPDPEKGRVVLNFFAWGYQDGKALATEMDYVPLPAPVVALVQKFWKENILNKSDKPIWP